MVTRSGVVAEDFSSNSTSTEGRLFGHLLTQDFRVYQLLLAEANVASEIAGFVNFVQCHATFGAIISARFLHYEL